GLKNGGAGRIHRLTVYGIGPRHPARGSGALALIDATSNLSDPEPWEVSCASAVANVVRNTPVSVRCMAASITRCLVRHVEIIATNEAEVFTFPRQFGAPDQADLALEWDFPCCGWSAAAT